MIKIIMIFQKRYSYIVYLAETVTQLYVKILFDIVLLWPVS